MKYTKEKRKIKSLENKKNIIKSNTFVLDFIFVYFDEINSINESLNLVIFTKFKIGL